MGRHRLVGLPPLPTDPRICRWCLSRLEGHPPATPACPLGCAPADAVVLLTGRCQDCGGEFRTGQKGGLYLCWQCERSAMTRQQAQWDAEGNPPRGYLKDRIAAGVNRQVMAAKAEGR
jgi:hypothetical protein